MDHFFGLQRPPRLSLTKAAIVALVCHLVAGGIMTLLVAMGAPFFPLDARTLLDFLRSPLVLLSVHVPAIFCMGFCLYLCFSREHARLKQRWRAALVLCLSPLLMFLLIILSRMPLRLPAIVREPGGSFSFGFYLLHHALPFLSLGFLSVQRLWQRRHAKAEGHTSPNPIA